VHNEIKENDTGGHIALTGENRNAFKFTVENIEGKNYMKYLGVDSKTLLGCV
jgi:hypothetical protein